MVRYLLDGDDARPKSIISAVHDVGIPPKYVQAVYEPSKMQDEMILATMMYPDHRVYVETYHFTTPNTIPTDRLYDAVHALARRHAVLRSIYCWNDTADHMESSVSSIAVLDADYVGRQARLVWEYSTSNGRFRPSPVRFHILGYRKDTTKEQWRGEMPWKISVVHLPHGQGSSLSLSFHHALMDGTTACRFLHSIHEELNSPGSASTESNFFVARKELESRHILQTQLELREKFSTAKPKLAALGESVVGVQSGQGELTRTVRTDIPSRAGSAAVPAWMARLALAMTLCTLQGTKGTVFHEITSGRGSMPTVLQKTFGLMIVPQIRWVDFKSNPSLLRVYQSLRSSNDINHAFSTGQLRSLFPGLTRHLQVCLTCHTNQSYPYNGVGDWVWSGREVNWDIPLTFELLPPKQGFFDVSVLYDRQKFRVETIQAMQEFFCASLGWIQDKQAQLQDYDLAHVVDNIRAGSKTLDNYIGSIQTQTSTHVVEETHEEYWSRELEGSKPAEFHWDKSRPEVPSGKAGVLKMQIKGALYHALQKFSNESQTTPFTVLLAAFRAAHYRMTSTDDATIGTLGPSAKMQCMRVQVEDGTTFAQLVEHVKSKAAATLAHEEVPFETIVSKLQPTEIKSQNPAIQTVFAVHPERLEKINGTYTTNVDMEAHLYQGNGGLQGEIFYATDVFHHRTIETVISVFLEILERGLNSPGTQIEDIALSNGQSSLHEMGLMKPHRTNYPRDSSIIDVFSEQVAKSAHAVAVKDASGQFTYSELDQKSDELARWLRGRGYAPETFIPVLAQRSCQAIVAFFGILKANLAYLPLDLKFPAERVKTILSSIEGPILVLTGQDVQRPEIALENIEFVSIHHALGAGSQMECFDIAANRPTAHSLAEVIFTSGSTGRPKGVLVEHRCIISCVKNSGIVRDQVFSTSFAHISSIAFDSSTWEIYGPLLNGGRVVCIDQMSALNYGAIQEIFSREKIRSAFITPALLKQYLVEAPSALAELHTLCAGGERSDPEDMYKALSLVQDEVVHVYGPTENTIYSTAYPLRRGAVRDEYSKHTGDRGVPIGRAVRNSGAYIVDRQKRIVPLGVMGELVLVGDGLARGYTDPVKTRENFVMTEINGEQVRAYCTGDRVRYRPADGQIEYCGRMDYQIKIRGFRVELGEVEHALLGSGLLEEAAVIMRKPEGQEAQLLGFVTEKKDAVDASHNQDVDGEQEQEQEEGWKDIFTSTTYSTAIETHQAGHDFTGWKSMYDGKDIDKEEMNEWLDDTMATIRNGLPSGNVLEIGTGSGMILFNLTEGLERYVGLDPVPSIVDFVQKAVTQTVPELADRIEVHVGMATDLDKLEGISIQPDLVVVNSVAQYFPSADYTLQVLQGLLETSKSKTIYFGDMRSYALYDQFQVTKALGSVGENASKSSMRQSIAESVRNETEFLADPAFFTSLPDRFPGLIRHVEIIPKRMKATNELSCYRFAAVIHTTHQHRHLPVHEVEKDQWIDFVLNGFTHEALLDILQHSPDTSVVAIANIPHSKTILERHIADALSSGGYNDVDADSDWISRLRQEANQCPSLSALELVELGRQTGFRVEVSWARQFSQKGGLDVVFHNIQPADGMERTMFRFPTDYEGRPSHGLTSTPMLKKSSPSLEKILRAKLQKQLPSYMVPAVIKVLGDLPINNNGKVDRRALSDIADAGQMEPGEEDTDYVEARNDCELAICEEFTNVLGTRIGIEHNFFDLGGHSLLATRATSKIVRRLACAITVKDLFDCPTPEALAQRILSNDNGPLHEDGGENGLGHDDIPQQLEVVGWHEEVQAVGLSFKDVVGVMPCTPFQEGVLSADIALEGASVYRSKIKIEFNANLNVDTLQSAWRATVEQEDMLRTAFLPVTKPLEQKGICSGAFLQAVLQKGSPEVRRASSLHRVTSSDTVDLGVGHIPVSLGIIQDQCSNQWTLELTIHHALQDGSYISSVLDRLSRNYHQASNRKDAETLGQRRHIPFWTFVRDLQNTDPQNNFSFWKTYLHGAPGVTWPVASGLNGPLESNRLPEIKKVEWRSNARTISKKLHNTPAGIARAAVALTIATHSDSDDVVLGEVSSGRSHDGFIAGPCIATHPVRIQLLDNNRRISLEKLLTRARNSYLDTIPYQQSGLLPIRKVTQNPDISPFQVLFVYQHLHHEPQGELDSLSKFTPVIDSFGQLDFPLVLEVACDDTTGHLGIQCVFDPVLLPSTDVDWILQHVVDALDMVADGVTSGLGVESRLPTTRKEQEMLQEFANIWGDAEGMNTVDEIIHQRAIKMPERIALQFEDKEYITYRHLDTMSTRMASGIRRLLDGQVTHSSSQPLIPIFFKKSIDMVVSILAILKAGAAFIPLNIDDPVKRLEAIFAATKPRVLIWDGIHGGKKLETLSNSTGACLYTRKDLAQISEPLYKPRRSSLDALAYVVFTSGSTGTPKGVLVEHRSLAAFTLSDEGSNDCSWTSNRLAWLEYTFDAAIGDIFATLCKGGCLSLVRRENLFSRLTGWLDDLCITHLALTPTLGTLLVDDLHESQRLAFLNTMIFGGEPFQPNFLRRAPKELNIWNGYGPSETTIEVSACLLQERGVRAVSAPPFVPIGKPTRGCQIHILRPGTDEQVHVGAVGEICVSGPQLARGYIGYPEYSSNPFQQRGENRVYRTGDLGRLHGDGLLEYLGRIDSQVKIRGLRIDLHELSSVAQSHPLINACAVTKVDRNGREVLIAFVEADQEAASFNKSPFAKVVRNHIAQHVPSYMIPDHYCIQTDPLPRTASGKMDMKAIRQMGEEKYGSCIESARNEPEILIRAEPATLEAKIASLWSQALGVEDDLDITTPFAHMGGDSLRAIILLALLRQNNIHLNMKDLSQSSTIQMQAARIRDTKPSNDEGVPDHLHVHRRQHRKGTIVLIHPFLAQSAVLEPLVPLLDDRLDVMLIDDPFFGKPECPRTITEWAHSYLTDIKPLVDPIEPVYLAGYSIGGQIAFEMALLWEILYKRQPDSVILLDPGSYGPKSPSMVDGHQRETAIHSSLGMLGLEAENLTLFEQHYDRLVATVRDTRTPSVYQGPCLYLTLSERLEDGIAEWWQARCVDISTHIVPCDNHFKLLNEDHIHLVSHLINTHCQMSMSSSPSMSPSEQGSSSSETSIEKSDKEVDFLDPHAQGGKIAGRSSLAAF